MKIVFVLENYIPHIGGVEVVFKNLCEGLAERNHEVSVVTHRMKGSPKFEIINGVSVHRVNCFHSRYLFTFFSVFKVLKLAKKADIIHTTTFNGAPPAWLASKLLRKKALITIHEVWVGKWKKLTEMGFLKSIVHDFLERMIYMLSFHRYVCVSNSTKKQLSSIGVNSDKIDVVYNGLDYKHWNPKKYNSKKIRDKLGLENNFVYFFSGRPGVSKGLEYLIRAVPEISRKIPNSKLLAVVSKDKAYQKRYDEIVKLIERLGIKDKVILHDPIKYSKLPEFVNTVDCVIVPSLAEGFGFAAAEACAMGKPVVVSNTTSLPEVVSGEFVLVQPRSCDSIAKGVIDCFNGKLNKTKLHKFLLEDNIKGYIKIYEGMLNGRRI